MVNKFKENAAFYIHNKYQQLSFSRYWETRSSDRKVRQTNWLIYKTYQWYATIWQGKTLSKTSQLLSTWQIKLFHKFHQHNRLTKVPCLAPWCWCCCVLEYSELHVLANYMHSITRVLTRITCIANWTKHQKLWSKS